MKSFNAVYRHYHFTKTSRQNQRKTNTMTDTKIAPFEPTSEMRERWPEISDSTKIEIVSRRLVDVPSLTYKSDVGYDDSGEKLGPIPSFGLKRIELILVGGFWCYYYDDILFVQKAPIIFEMRAGLDLFSRDSPDNPAALEGTTFGISLIRADIPANIGQNIIEHFGEKFAYALIPISEIAPQSHMGLLFLECHPQDEQK